MSKDNADEFHLDFTQIQRVPHFVGFEVQFRAYRGPQRFFVEVYVGDDEASWENVVRLAMHRLHEDFARLARETEQFKLSPEQLEKLA